MKPGYKTTEFWLSLLTVLISAVASSGLFASTSPAARLISIALATLTSLGYTASRTSLKSSTPRDVPK
jgi:hypothetical protein